MPPVCQTDARFQVNSPRRQPTVQHLDIHNKAETVITSCNSTGGCHAVYAEPRCVWLCELVFQYFWLKLYEFHCTLRGFCPSISLQYGMLQLYDFRLSDDKFNRYE